jgi:hypothetical protein
MHSGPNVSPETKQKDKLARRKAAITSPFQDERAIATFLALLLRLLPS